MKRPPEKLSSLIRLALDDLAKCEDDDDYVVSMNVWHESSWDGNYCRVCFAGAVMAQTLETPLHAKIFPIHHRRWYHALRALNFARNGFLRDALRELGLPIPEQLNDQKISFYQSSPAAFRKDMWRAAEELERFGL